MDVMKTFLEPFARKERKPSLQPRKMTPYIELYTEQQFNNDILYNEKGAIVFFTENRLPIENQLHLFEKLRGEVRGAIQIAVFFINPKN
jgi:hypothetical protein